MKTYKSIFTALIAMALGCSFSAKAQQANSAFFLDNYAYSYRLNPAIMPEKSFAGIGIGNFQASLKSDYGINSLLYPNAAGNGLVTGLNSQVSSETFLGNLPEAGGLNVALNENILAVGVRTRNAFTSVELNLRSDVGAYIPRDLFAFLKNGSSDTPYDLSGFEVSSNTLLELAVGHTRKIGTDFTVGGRLKLLGSVLRADATFNKADLTVNGNTVATDVDAEMRIAAPIDFSAAFTDEGLNFGNVINGDINWAALRPASYGFAVDLGMTYKPIKDLTLSAGILDFGKITYKYGTIAGSEASVAFHGIEDFNVSGSESLGDTFQSLGDDLAEIADFKLRAGESLTISEMMPYTINAGARYRIPFYRRLSVGAMYSFHHGSIMNNSEARLGATVTPLNILSLSGNIGTGTYGAVCGAGLSVNLLGINLHLAVDGYKGNVAVFPIEGVSLPIYEGIPVPVGKFNYVVNAGVTFQFIGRRWSDFSNN